MCTNGLAPIALTTGEPAGIGPEVSVRSVYETDQPVCLIGNRHYLESLRERLELPAWPDRVSFQDVALASPVVPGTLNIRNAEYVLRCLDLAVTGTLNGAYSAVCTAPVQKSIINDAGFHFTGHTEYFAQTVGVDKVVMMLTSSEHADALRVALVTTHLPIAQVAQAVTYDNVLRTLSILDHDLKYHFGIISPKIAVAGLNPHAGEGGHLGEEEITRIIPAIEAAQRQGIDCSGPFPADTLFTPAHLNESDAVLCMYHDQGLPVLKHVGFHSGINITLGLPFIRTSVDHGTALDIAGLGIADIGSMKAALALAGALALKKHHG